MDAIKRQSLKDAKAAWDRATDEDRDELLTDLLILVYPTKALQNA